MNTYIKRWVTILNYALAVNVLAQKIRRMERAGELRRGG